MSKEKETELKEEIEMKVMKLISLLFPLSKEPIAITYAIELAIQETIKDEIKFLDRIVGYNQGRIKEEINKRLEKLKQKQEKKC